jgi:hypothetical protein
MNDEIKSESKIQSDLSKEPIGFHPKEEEDEGLYGWKFHRGPLLAAVVLTVCVLYFRLSLGGLNGFRRNDGRNHFAEPVSKTGRSSSPA